MYSAEPSTSAAVRAADDLVFDMVSQIRMPRWADGRVALVGDAAYAPSFLTGRAPASRSEKRNALLRGLAATPPAVEGLPAHAALVLPEFTPTAALSSGRTDV